MSAIENTFGHGVRIHPVTKRPLEQGIGHLSDEAQAMLHIAELRSEGHTELADAMLAEMKTDKQKVAADEHLAVVEHDEEITHG